MRRANKPEFLKHPKSDEIIGINLSADFCAEHEWGIEKIRKAFGMDANLQYGERSKPTRDNFGIGRRTIQEVPKDFYFVTHGDYAFMWFRESWRKEEDQSKLSREDLERMMDRAYGEEIASAWDESGFAVRVKGSKNIDRLKKIYDAAKNKDAAIFLGGGGFLENAGLVIVIRSKLPEEFVQMHHDKDLETIELNEAKDASGIEKILRDAGKEWFALSPSWGKNKELRFLLNPYEQDKYEFGWYTVEELKQWAEGKGPVIKTQQQRRR